MVALPALAALALTAVSCLKGGESSYTDYSFANVESASTLKTDTGLKFRVTSDETDGGWKTEGRVYVRYTIKGGEGTQDGYYGVALSEYAPVQLKRAIRKSQSDSTVYGSDPVQFRGGSISGTAPGRYLNVLACYTARKNSSTAHTVDLVIDDSGEEEGDCLRVSLTHNGSGEVYGNPSIPGSEFELAYRYLSFPLDEMVGDKSSMRIDYVFYNMDSSGSYGTGTSTQTITVNFR